MKAKAIGRRKQETSDTMTTTEATSRNPIRRAIKQETWSIDPKKNI